MLVISVVFLTRPVTSVSPNHDKLDTPGVLQLTWLLSDAKMENENTKIADHLKNQAKGDVNLKRLREIGKEIPVAGWPHDL